MRKLSALTHGAFISFPAKTPHVRPLGNRRRAGSVLTGAASSSMKTAAGAAYINWLSAQICRATSATATLRYRYPRSTGRKHMKTGETDFLYLLLDSGVPRLLRHEETFGLDKLYELCEIAREELTEGGHNISRVIARPFIGEQNRSLPAHR